jgi:putative MATE family efflux protein
MTNQRGRLAAFTHIFRLFRSAVAGTEKEFTTGNINRAIFMLAVPMVLEMSMESLFAVVDIFFVGKLGVDAVATVGLTESLITIVYSLGFGLSMAATAMVARRTGEKDPDGAAHAAMQAIYVALTLSILIGVVGILFAKDLLLLMGARPALVEQNYHYTQMVLGSNVVIMLLFMINGIFRGAGDASIAMRSLWLANIINIILCPLLINGLGPVPALGLKGAALATIIGRGTGVTYQLIFLLRGRGLVRIKMRHLSPDLKVIWSVIRIGAGSTAQMLINSASWIFLVRIISGFGSDALAGYTIGIRVIIFTLLPALGVSNAAATLVGQNLGASQPERAEKSAWNAAFMNMCFLGIVALIFFIGAEHIIRIFNNQENVVAYGTQCLRFICTGYVFYGYGMVIISSFNGAGDTVTPTIINLFGFWAFQIPVAYMLAIFFKLGPVGVYWAIAISESAIAIAAILLFRRGKWKVVKV